MPARSIEGQAVAQRSSLSPHVLKAAFAPARLTRAPGPTFGYYFFVIEVRGLKDDDVRAEPDVCFTVIDTESRAYLSIGEASLLNV